MIGNEVRKLFAGAMTKNDSGQARKVEGCDHGKRLMVDKSGDQLFARPLTQTSKSVRFIDTFLKNLL